MSTSTNDLAKQIGAAIEASLVAYQSGSRRSVSELMNAVTLPLPAYVGVVEGADVRRQSQIAEGHFFWLIWTYSLGTYMLTATLVTVDSTRPGLVPAIHRTITFDTSWY
jgi:hypothetical protein